VKIEYITDAVLAPGLRCFRCRSKVRQVRAAPTAKSQLAVALAEPATFLVLGVAAGLGYLLEAVFGVTLVLIVIGPTMAVYLYVRGLRTSTFWCTSC
jgi:ABC-type siderophore export system fused ATPase/permease subunit